MPKEYEDIKKSYMDKGKSKEEAEAIAAATYNKHIRKHKKDKRPIGNKAQQKAGSALSESFKLIEDLLIENNNGVSMIPKGSLMVVENDDSFGLCSVRGCFNDPLPNDTLCDHHRIIANLKK